MVPADPASQIAVVEAEPVLAFAAFGNDDAVDLGLLAVATIRERGDTLAVRIVLGGDIVFQAKPNGTGPGNDPWLAGKALLVEATGEPSILARLRAESRGVNQRPLETGATAKGVGGSWPILVGGLVVGTFTTSGMADIADHAAGVEIIRRYLAAR